MKMLLILASLLVLPVAQAADVTPEEAQAIAKEAYIYGFPLVDAYRIQNAYFVNKASPEYKAPYNTLASFARVFTPDDTLVQTPNSDTPYSFVALDLRAEPLVLTVPAIQKDRYFSIQMIDLYTFNFDYIGSRTTGNAGGSFLIVGPGWKGQVPKDFKRVIHADTELVIAIYRTQLFSAKDIDNVKKIQAEYKAQSLSAFLGQPAPKPAPPIDFFKPLNGDEQKTSLEFFNELNFILAYCPTDPSEKALMARFAKINVGAGKTLDVAKLPPGVRQAMQAGIADAWAEFEDFKKTEFSTGKVTAGDVFGTRASLNNNYLYRMAAAVLGIFGNTAQEAMYPSYPVDSKGQPLDGAHHRYTIHFAKGELPPVNAFWSLTMYKLPSSLLVANPINRYLINSPMLPQMTTDADGGLTIYVQNASPGTDKEANWLPAPSGPFVIFMRLYWPKAAALEGKWKQPPLVQTN